jgi:hypothetical protein
MIKKSASKRRKIIFLMIGISVSAMGVFMIWAYMALTFPWLQTAGRLPKGDFAFTAAPSQPESEVIAAVSFRSGVFWVDEFILHDGIGVAFGPFHRYVVLAPRNFPDWHVVDSGVWNGPRSEFDFTKYSAQAFWGNP